MKTTATPAAAVQAGQTIAVLGPRGVRREVVVSVTVDESGTALAMRSGTTLRADYVMVVGTPKQS